MAASHQSLGDQLVADAKQTTWSSVSLTNTSDTTLTLNVTKPRNAVYHISDFGPVFGAGRDLFVSDLSNKNKDSYMKLQSYEYPEGKGGKAGDEFIWEVQIIISKLWK